MGNRHFRYGLSEMTIMSRSPFIVDFHRLLALLTKLGTRVVEINQLRYFLSVVEVGSFSKAALHSFISQPALSEQIQRLEDEVGKTLLHRNPKKIVPTDAGLLLIGRAKSVLAQIEMAKREIKG